MPAMKHGSWARCPQAPVPAPTCFVVHFQPRANDSLVLLEAPFSILSLLLLRRLSPRLAGWQPVVYFKTVARLTKTTLTTLRLVCSVSLVWLLLLTLSRHSWLLQCPPPACSSTSTSAAPLDVWHRLLGHPRYDTLSQLKSHVRDFVVTGSFKPDKSLGPGCGCDACVRFNFHRHLHTDTEAHTTTASG